MGGTHEDKELGGLGGIGVHIGAVWGDEYNQNPFCAFMKLAKNQ